MAQISGKYEWVKNDNMVAYLEALGVTVDDALKSKLSSGSLSIQLNRNNGTITTQSGFGDARSHTFAFDEAFEEDFGGDYKAQSVATFDGSKITIISTGKDGVQHTRIYEFDELGCKVTHTSPKTNIVGVKFFKRI